MTIIIRNEIDYLGEAILIKSIFNCNCVFLNCKAVSVLNALAFLKPETSGWKPTIDYFVFISDRKRIFM